MAFAARTGIKRQSLHHLLRQERDRAGESRALGALKRNDTAHEADRPDKDRERHRYCGASLLLDCICWNSEALSAPQPSTPL